MREAPRRKAGERGTVGSRRAPMANNLPPASPMIRGVAFPFLDLGAIPIRDPWEEKRMSEAQLAEGNFIYIFYLMDKAGTDKSSLPPRGAAALGARIKEVYRLCFDSNQDTTVLSDFCSHYPELAFNCEWLAETIREPWARHKVTTRHAGMRKLILLALSNGLRRATRPRMIHKLLAARREAARYALKSTTQDLTEFCEREVARPPWEKVHEQRIKAIVGEKVSELSSNEPCLNPLRPELEALLLERQAYRAAVKITAKVFNVRERDLQTKTPL